MRLVKKDSISRRQIFYGAAFLDQVTASEPLSPKFFRYKQPYYYLVSLQKLKKPLALAPEEYESGIRNSQRRRISHK